MTKKHSHIIQGMQVDFRVDDRSAGDEVLQMAGDIVKSKIVPITEKVLDEWNEDNTRIKLDRLEIDLGTIPLESFVSSMPDVFEKRIRDSLSELFSRSSPKKKQVKKVAQEKALLEEFIAYLKFGRFSWQVHRELTQTPDEMLVVLLESNKKQLLKELKSLLDQPVILNRLVRSLKTDTMDLLLAEMAFGDAATQAMLLIGALCRFTHEQSIELSRQQVERAVYRQALGRAIRNQVIFSGKTVASVFHDLMNFLQVDSVEKRQYVKYFAKFRKNDDFLKQYADLKNSLKKENELDLSEEDKQVLVTGSNEENSKEETAKDAESLEPKEMIFPIKNAGLVLVYPYLKTLFERMEWMSVNTFSNVRSAQHAVLVMDYLVYGDKAIVAEHDLVLNKLLCGLLPQQSIDPLLSIEEQHRKEVDSLLESAIQHWSVLKNTSIEGYRYSFLQREGVLSYRESHWHLRVERKSMDLLLEALPYTLSIIQLPWMAEKLVVEW